MAIFKLLTEIESAPLPSNSRPITRIGIHHSASSYGDARTFDRWHRDRGFREIGYHFVIHNGTYYPKGWIELGREIEEIPASHKPFNERSIGICVVGNFDEEGVEDRFDPRFMSVASLVNFYRAQLKISIEEVYGHRELSPTACPGGNIDLDQMRNYIDYFYPDKISLALRTYEDRIKIYSESRDRVGAIQRILNELGVNPELKVDGILGTKTRQALENITRESSLDKGYRTLINKIRYTKEN